MQSNKIGSNVVVLAVLACALSGMTYFLPVRMAAQVKPTSGAEIRGTVRSTEGNPLYGILVKARGEGKNYATSVVTDGSGQYEFPPLPVGEYQLISMLNGNGGAVSLCNLFGVVFCTLFGVSPRQQSRDGGRVDFE